MTSHRQKHRVYLRTRRDLFHTEVACEVTVVQVLTHTHKEHKKILDSIALFGTHTYCQHSFFCHAIKAIRTHTNDRIVAFVQLFLSCHSNKKEEVQHWEQIFSLTSAPSCRFSWAFLMLRTVELSEPPPPHSVASFDRCAPTDAHTHIHSSSLPAAAAVHTRTL